MLYILIRSIGQNSNLKFMGSYGILLLIIIFTNDCDPAFILATSILMLCFAVCMILADHNFFEFWWDACENIGCNFSGLPQNTIYLNILKNPYINILKNSCIKSSRKDLTS